MIDEESNLFDQAGESRILLSEILSVVLFFIMIVAGQFIGSFFISSIGIRKHGVEYVMENTLELISSPLGLILSFIFSLILCLLWVKVAEKRKISSLGLKGDRFLTKFVKGFFVGIILFSSVVILMYVFGVISLKQGINIGIKSLPSILLFLPGWIVQGSSEEILSRGWLMHIVGAKHKPLIGFIVSSAAFGLLHMFNPGVDALSIVNIILVGFMFGLYVIHTQDLWGACGIHAAWNFSQANIFGFSVSGLGVKSDSLLKFSSKGSNLLTGGQFGPEASIFATVVIVVAIAILVFKLERQELT